MPLKLLRRVYNMLAEVFGHDSEECVATKRKIFALEMKDGGTDVSSTGIVTEKSLEDFCRTSKENQQLQSCGSETTVCRRYGKEASTARKIESLERAPWVPQPHLPTSQLLNPLCSISINFLAAT
jgi:hypothetical protein